MFRYMTNIIQWIGGFLGWFLRTEDLPKIPRGAGLSQAEKEEPHFIRWIFSTEDLPEIRLSQELSEFKKKGLSFFKWIFSKEQL